MKGKTYRAIAILITALTAAFIPALSPPLVMHAKRVRLGPEPPGVRAGAGVEVPELGAVPAGRTFSSFLATESSV